MKIFYQKAQTKFFLFCITMVLLCIVPASAGLEGPVIDALSYYNQAVDAAAEGSYEEAMNLIDKSLQIQPDFYLAQITKASLLSQKSEYKEAEDLLMQAEQSHPDNAFVLAAQASLFIETGRYKEALDAADAALEKDPSLVEAWVLKGTAHGGLAQYEEEINASDRALQIEPAHPQALSNLKFATESLTIQNKTGQDDAERTPLSIPVVLAGALFALVFREKM
jgi:tetratricopeptide (TPR) repeat protein